ncbi:MAG: hypothetical protein H0X34_14475 [Chthoniobacterales bacterium]|nr:hypothetical protein [Chthoniobacterales bacterium]
MRNQNLFFSFQLLLALLLLPLLGVAQSTGESGIEGSILVSPVMGGPTRQGAPDAKPLPQTEFLVKQGESVVATFQTDEQGHFRVSLGAGHYSVVKREKGAMGFFGPFEVDVPSGKMKTVQWKCDSGIR